MDTTPPAAPGESLAGQATAQAAAPAAMTVEQATQHLIENDPAFELTEITLNGIRYKAFRNIPETVSDLMEQGMLAHDDGAAPYLFFEDEHWSYGAFCNEVRHMAGVLHDTLGVRRGDRVALVMRNFPELPILTLAVASLGATAVFMNAWWTGAELDYALRDCEPRAVFADGARVAAIMPLKDRHGFALIGLRDGDGMCEHSYRALRNAWQGDAPARPQIMPEDDFAIMYSSGTTGHPKGVVQTHRAAVTAVYCWMMQAAIAPLRQPPAPNDPAPLPPSFLITTPLFHVTAMYPLFLFSLPSGARITLMYKWDAHQAIDIIRRNAVTRFLGVPTQSADLLTAVEESDAELPSLRFIGAGGAKRPAAQVDQLAQRFPQAMIATGWGMTETCALGIGMTGEEYSLRPEAAGHLHPPVQEMRIIDDAGRDLPPGEVGEIVIKSPAVMRCYLNQPEATAETLRDGWLHSGDLGTVDADGFVTILDRKKNIIIRGGENIACLDVEGAIHRHPDVIEASAFALPHDRLGEVVGAALHLRPGAWLDRDTLAAFLRDRLAHFKIPERIWCQHDPLPRASTEKTDRRAIRAACLAEADQSV